MPSNSFLAYADVQEALDQALESERGIRVKCINAGTAINTRQRMYKFRLLDRENNKSIYQEGDPLWGRSVYDVLLFEALDSAGNRIQNRKNSREGEAYVQVTKNHTGRLEIEEL